MKPLPAWAGFLAIALLSIAKGYGDASWGDPGAHPGTKYDMWHLITRYGYFYPAVIGWLIPQKEYFTRRGLAIALGVAAVLSFAFFRAGVAIAGKYGAWYG